MPKQSLTALTETMFYVLIAFRNGEMCGIDIADFIERHTGGRVKIGPATLYTILGKFESEKLIREINVEGRKRTYIITDKGTALYESEVERLRKCIADAERMSGKGV